MRHFIDNVQDVSGKAIAGATVTVKKAGLSTLASLFSDDGITSTSNPVLTAADGSYGFYVANGRYDLVAAFGVTSITQSDVEIVDLTEANSGDAPVNFRNLNGVRNAAQFSSLQAAISDLPTSGGTVFLPPGNYTVSAPLTLMSNLKIVGSGSGQADSVTPATTITFTGSSGDLFYFNAGGVGGAGFNDCYLGDFAIKYTGSGANSAIRLTAAQRNTFERLYISGPFGNSGTGVVQLDSSSTANASCIWNSFRDIHETGTVSGGHGLLLDSKDANAKVINGNFFYNFQATGGAAGASACGIKLTNSGVHNQVINENVFWASEAVATAGTAILVDNGSTRGCVFIDCDAEGSVTGVNKATNNTLTFLGGNISANSGSNLVDSQPIFSQFIGTNVGGTVQTLGISPAGLIQCDSIAMGGTGGSSTNTINGGNGWQLNSAGSANLIFNSTSTECAKNLIFDAGKTITQYNGLATVGNGVSSSMGASDLTGQSASNAAVTLLTGTTSSGGHYRLNWFLAITTADGGGATVALTITFVSDGITRTTGAGATAVAATSNSNSGNVTVQIDNSTNITYTTTVAGAIGGGKYAAHVWISKE